jgi:cytochrome b subunit of formate dehydrogenase
MGEATASSQLGTFACIHFYIFMETKGRITHIVQHIPLKKKSPAHHIQIEKTEKEGDGTPERM